MHGPPFRRVLLFLGYIFLQTRRLITHDSANRCHEPIGAAARLAAITLINAYFVATK
jgi:hypothetical protein